MATTYMNLTLPVVGTTVGPTWASLLNAALTSIDAHTHLDGSGALIVPDALNLNADVTLQQNNLTNIRALRMYNNTAAVNGADDIRTVYVKNNNLFYNTEAGTAVQITDGSALNTGAIATNVFATTSVTTNLTILAADTFTYLLVSTASARNITLPLASAVTAGRFYVVKDITGSAASNNITLVRAGSDSIDGTAGNKALKVNSGSWFVVSDGVSKWHLFNSDSQTIDTGNTLTIASGGTLNVASGGALTIAGTSYFPQFGTARTKSRVFSYVPDVTIAGWDTSSDTSIASSSTGADLHLKIPAHAGATLDSIDIFYKIGSSHFPDTKLAFSARYVNVTTGVSGSMGGSGSAAGTNASEYYNGGAVQTFTITPDTQNTSLDPSAYLYYAVITEEFGSGSVAGNRIYGCRANFSAIADTQFE